MEYFIMGLFIIWIIQDNRERKNHKKLLGRMNECERLNGLMYKGYMENKFKFLSYHEKEDHDHYMCNECGEYIFENRDSMVLRHNHICDNVPYEIIEEKI